MPIDVCDLQILVFEAGADCNLSALHERCPAHLGEGRYARLDRLRPLDDATIIETARRFYGEFNFRGLVAWHYYNEPLLQIERIIGLTARIKRLAPAARFLLWTNGTKIPDDPDRLRWCELIRVTDYGGENRPQNLGCARQACQRVYVHPVQLDARRQPLGPDSDATCQRPYTEFIVDCFGNVHLCCIDWRGLASPGNILRDGLDECLAHWRDSANKIVGRPMAKDAPQACRRCAMRFGSKSNFA